MAFNMQFNLRRKDPGTPWGFRIGGGMDAQHGFQALFVERVASGGLAERAGMQAYDRIEFIGGDDARLMVLYMPLHSTALIHALLTYTYKMINQTTCKRLQLSALQV